METNMLREISIVYRKVGDSHVFTTLEFNGFQVGGPSLKRAFENLPEALSAHVSALEKAPMRYTLTESWQDFEGRLRSDNFFDSLIALIALPHASD
jgi:hypothetical protein